MKDYELRKVKCFPEMSEETEAFTAQLWVDGKHLANVKNSGQGGCNEYQPVKPFTWKDTQIYQTMQMDYEIGLRVIEMDETRKKQRKGFYLRKGDLEKAEYFIAKFPKPLSTLKKYGNYSSWVTDQKAQMEAKGFTVLNTNL